MRRLWGWLTADDPEGWVRVEDGSWAPVATRGGGPDPGWLPGARAAALVVVVLFVVLAAAMLVG